MRISIWLGVAACVALAACSSSPSPKHSVGGTVAGVTADGLVLQNNGGDDLAIPGGATEFTFPSQVSKGSAYAVTVRSAPAGLRCDVAAGSGTVGDADVRSVAVACGHSVTTTVSGLASPATAIFSASFGGAPATDVTVTASGVVPELSRAALPVGADYAIEFKPQAGSSLQCTVTNGKGKVGDADVAVEASCSSQTFTIGGAVSGLTAPGLKLHTTAGSQDVDVSPTAATYAFQQKVATGADYTVTVAQQPPNSGLFCAVANPTGKVAQANVTNANVTCTQVTVQRWSAPATFGGLFPASATRVQHAYFNGTTIVEEGAGITWSAQGTAPAQRELRAFPMPAGGPTSRFGAGPFTATDFFRASGDNAVGAVTGDMIACVVFKPDYNALPGGGDRPIFARGVSNGRTDVTVGGGGWALVQTSDSTGNFFSFSYEYQTIIGGRARKTADVPTFFANETRAGATPGTVQVTPDSGPLNPSIMIFCGGRHENTIHAVVNSVALDYAGPVGQHYGADIALVGNNNGPPYTTLDAGSHTLTIGGFDQASPNGTAPFRGRVYETAVWNEPGTPANIQAKIAAVVGLNAAGARYVRNREAPFYGADAVAGQPAAGYHTLWNDWPRIDPTRGFLFGLQSWNRLSEYAIMNTGGELFVYVPGEDPSVAPIVGVVRPGQGETTPGNTVGWTPSTGVTVAATGDVAPPGDSERNTSKQVTMPPGGTLSSVTDVVDAPGQLHGQIWLRKVSGTGKLVIRNDTDVLVGSNHFDIDLASLPDNAWTRVWLYRDPGGPGNELVTPGSAGRSIQIAAAPDNSGPISFYFWGFDLTQLGSATAAARLTADPGAVMYDWNASKDPNNFGNPTNIIDALQLAPIATSTAQTGFCVGVEATMPPGFSWASPFTLSRTALALVADPKNPANPIAKLYLGAATSSPGQICFSVAGASAPVCAAAPASFTAGSKHVLRGCMSAAGQMRLYADASATPLAAAAGGVATPDVNGATPLVGGAAVIGDAPVQGDPWHGYISAAGVCRDGDGLAACP